MASGVTGLIQSIGGFGSDEDLYGKKPVVPPRIDFEQLTQENIALLPSLKNLASLSTDALADLMERAMPGYKTLRDSTTGSIQNLLTGQATDYERNTLRRIGAELGVESGQVGGDFGNYKTLGVSLQFLNQRTQQGLSSAQQWIAQSQSRTFDFSKMFKTREDAQFDWQRDWLAAQVEAAPDPAKRGAFDSEMAFIGMVLSAYGGGAGYTQGYNPSGGGAGAGGGYGGGAGGGYSYFGGPSGYGSTYEGYGGRYQSVPTDDSGGGASMPLF